MTTEVELQYSNAASRVGGRVKRKTFPAFRDFLSKVSQVVSLSKRCGHSAISPHKLERIEHVKRLGLAAMD
jgi:hypothetical protein